MTPERAKLEAELKASTSAAKATQAGTGPAPKASTSTNHHKIVFEIDKRVDRQSLQGLGQLPQQYTKEELEDLDLPTSDLCAITPSTAQYYKFNTAKGSLGSNDALQTLKRKGCTDVSQAWVDNHWSLVLWKLAGMSALQPDHESSDDTRRWCWDEVIRQLLYRYEREIKRGVRPPLRRIVARDSQAASPMILCVSGVLPGANGSSELEVTDGWYRLHASVDTPMARAIQKGTIRVGRKLAVAGASLWSEHKDPQEILELSDTVKLTLNGNGSHLAPWHAKLGFLRFCPTATLRSLTSDGGIIPLLDVVVMQVFPTLYIEMHKSEGKLVGQGTRNEKEEFAERDRWMRARENEESRLREIHEKTFSRYEGYASRLDAKAGSNFTRGEDGPPDSVYDYYDQLEEPEDAVNVFKVISPREAGWLAWYIRESQEKTRDRMREEVIQELDQKFPPRQVHSVRTLLVEDAETSRHPATRIAQLSIWDVMNYSVVEGKPGHFAEGFRLQIPRVHPTHHSAWMGHEPNAQIFLCTKSSSTIWRIK